MSTNNSINFYFISLKLVMSMIFLCFMLQGCRALYTYPTNNSSVKTSSDAPQLEPWPQIEKFPLKIHIDSIQDLRQLASTSKSDFDQVLKYFYTSGDYPFAKLTYLMDTSGVKAVTNIPGSIKYELNGNPQAILNVLNWNEEGDFLIEVKSKMNIAWNHWFSVGFIGYNMNEPQEIINLFWHLQFQNTFVKLLKMLDNRRPEIETLYKNFLDFKSGKQAASPSLPPIDQSKIRRAEELIKDLESVDPSNPQLPALRERLKKLKENVQDINN